MEKNLPSMCEVLGLIPSMAIEIRKGIEKPTYRKSRKRAGRMDAQMSAGFKLNGSKEILVRGLSLSTPAMQWFCHLHFGHFSLISEGQKEIKQGLEEVPIIPVTTKGIYFPPFSLSLVPTLILRSQSPDPKILRERFLCSKGPQDFGRGWEHKDIHENTISP